MNQPLKAAADALDATAKDLEDFRQAMQAIDSEDVTPQITNMAITRIIGVLSHMLESLGLLGEHISLLTGTMQSAGAVLAGQAVTVLHQCPECGLPLGSNASDANDDKNPCGCRTCTIVTQQHRNAVGNKCSDCGCLIGSNSDNCRRCLDEAYFQRTSAYQASQGPTHHG